MPKFEEWIVDKKAMTCRNKHNNLVLAMEPYEEFFLGKIKVMPKELRKKIATEPDGKKQVKDMIHEGAEVFFWKYNENKIKARQKRNEKELEIIIANKNKLRFEEYWKNELIKTAELMLKIYGKKTSSKQIFNLEKSIKACISHIKQYGDYYFDTKRKYPQKINVSYWAVYNRTVKKYNFHGHYDMNNIKFHSIKLKDLFCNYDNVSMCPEYITSDIVLGIYLYSENENKDLLYKIELFKFAQLFFSLGKDETVVIEPEFDKQGKLTHYSFSDTPKPNELY